ncbi:Uncharacterised protein [Mycobacteroides abscessus subsp. abscessus]|nr:Uncharacterised protein [Mycobacteroides abscessus subsp. abscessus]
MMGRKLTSGCGSSIRPSAPSWKISTVAPKVAAIDSRKPSAAVSGTRIERNTRISSRKAAPATIAR